MSGHTGGRGALRVVVVGLGAIGLELVKALLEKPRFLLTGAADPLLAGQDVGSSVGRRPLGLPIAARAEDVFREGGDVAILLTSSSVAEIAPLVEAAVAARFNVVSSCEELSYPAHRDPTLAARLDALAQENGVSILGTGINPGFVMDRLPLLLASACVTVEHVRVERVVDAALRRVPLRLKVGAGLSTEAFAAGVAEGHIGHRGLEESCALVASGLGVGADEIKALIEPVVSDTVHPRPGIPGGAVAGVRQSARAFKGGQEVVRLDLEMSVGATNPRDRILITGDPSIDVTLAGGIHGDRGTVGALLSAVPLVAAAAPGLLDIRGLGVGG